MLLLTSRRKTGLSSGKIRMTFYIAFMVRFMHIKKRPPEMFWNA